MAPPEGGRRPFDPGIVAQESVAWDAAEEILNRDERVGLDSHRETTGSSPTMEAVGLTVRTVLTATRKFGPPAPVGPPDDAYS
jgi:hypothetical protein